MRCRQRSFVVLTLVGVVFVLALNVISLSSEMHRLRREQMLQAMGSDSLLGQTEPRGQPSGQVTRCPLTSDPRTRLLAAWASRSGHVPGVNCRAVTEGDVKEIAHAQDLMKRKQVPLSVKRTDDEFVEATQNCVDFRWKFAYDIYKVSEEERAFPIAFNILLYKEVTQFELLLHAIYRPHNQYCVHVDAKASPSVLRGVKAIASCLPNVFLASKMEHVIYAGFSRLQADVTCMTDHLRKPVQWRYLLNLPSQQFPLKTNAELVKILTIYNGSNDVEGITNKMLGDRYTYSWTVVNNQSIARTRQKKRPPPHNITIVKGSAYGVFSRAFVQFVLSDQRAKDLLRWMEDVKSPDEYYWAMLHHSPQLEAPGSYTTGDPMKKIWLAVYASWPPRDPCRGRVVRSVCIFGIRDLAQLVERKELFANKFHLDFEPLVVQCLEEWIANKTASPLPFKSWYYHQLSFVKKPQNAPTKKTKKE